MTTSLPGFPSALTVIPVPEGDVSKHYADFFVNQDLKRLGCSGRVGLTLAHPNNATVAKFYQLYKTSDKNPLYSSVIELVRLCQTALHLFGVLDSEYLDGLLCDVTENAISKWWRSLGMDIYGAGPSDGVLGPTTVAALLGLLIGARNRLHSVNVAVPKDAFDVQGMKRGIWHFQKTHKLHKTRRIDEQTLRKLHAVTEKATGHADGGWRVPKAVKSTVAELSGKGEELAAEGNLRKAKAGIADIETLDMETFEQLVSGARGRWLWHAKPLKRGNPAVLGEAALDGLLSPKGLHPEAGIFGKKSRTSDGPVRKSFEDPGTAANKSPRRSLEDKDPFKPPAHHGHTIRKVHGVLDDGKAGFDRLIGAVQKRPTDPMHAHGHVDASEQTKKGRPSIARSHTSPTGNMSTSPTSFRGPSSTLRNEVNTADIDDSPTGLRSAKLADDSQTRLASMDLQSAMRSPKRLFSIIPDVGLQEATSLIRQDSQPSRYHGVDLDEYLPIPHSTEETIPPILRKTASLDAMKTWHAPRLGKSARQLSFGLAENSIHMSDNAPWPEESGHSDDDEYEYVRQRFNADHMKRVRLAIKQLTAGEAAWTTEQMESLEHHLKQSIEDEKVLKDYHEAPSQAAQQLQEKVEITVRDEQEIIEDGRRALETLAAKLDYEIDNLQSKIEDVELEVGDFERAVKSTEFRLDEVEDTSESSPWQCIVS